MEINFNDADFAEDVSLVTFFMHEVLFSYPEISLPHLSRYHVFGGFPGFCDQAAAAGIALHRAFAHFDRDCWTDIVESYVKQVIHYAVEAQAPLSPIRLASLAEQSRHRAVREGNATIRNCGDTQTTRPVFTQKHIVTFEVRQHYCAEVYAQDECQAVEIARHLYAAEGEECHHFHIANQEATSWSAKS